MAYALELYGNPHTPQLVSHKALQFIQKYRANETRGGSKKSKSKKKRKNKTYKM